MSRPSGVHLPEVLFTLLPLIALGPLASLWLFLFHRPTIRHWGPFVVVGALYGIVVVRFALAPVYLLPALAPLACVLGVSADRLSSTWTRTLLVGMCVFGIAVAWPGWRMGTEGLRSREDLRWLQGALRGREALLDGGHIYRYYLGPGYAIRSLTVSYQHDSLSVREKGSYRLLEREDVAGKVVVVRNSRQGFFGSLAEKTLLQNCQQIRRPTITLFDCAGVEVRDRVELYVKPGALVKRTASVKFPSSVRSNLPRRQ